MRALALFGSFWTWSARRVKVREERKEFEAKMASTLVWIKEAKQEWRQRVKNAQHLLTGKDWRDPEGKEEFVRQVYRGEVPQYLWYAIGDEELSGDDCAAIITSFWEEGGCGFGDIELHHSNFSEIGVGLRIRNPQKFASEITVGGSECPLYQTGNSEGLCDRQRPFSFFCLYQHQQIEKE